MQCEIHGAQRKRLPSGDSDTRHGWAQARGIFAYEETVYLQVSRVRPLDDFVSILLTEL